MAYNIIVINNKNILFKNICRIIEKNIVEENLAINGGTLNYSHLTFDSELLLLAMDGEEIIGFNSLVTFDNTYYVWQIAVKKELQGKGIGTELMKKAMEIALEKDMDVTANVMDYNEKSKKMFLNLGFIKEGYSSKNNGFYRYYQKQKKFQDIL